MRMYEEGKRTLSINSFLNRILLPQTVKRGDIFYRDAV